MGKECISQDDVGKHLGDGMEHRAFMTADGKRVVKFTRRFHRWTLMLQNKAETMQEELDDSICLVKDTEIKIPKTEIVACGDNDYLVYQDFVRDDESVGDVGLYLLRQVINSFELAVEDEEFEDGSREVVVTDVDAFNKSKRISSLVDEYVHEPKNFIPNGSKVWWIDPTEAPIARMLKRISRMKILRRITRGGMGIEQYRSVRRRLSKLIRLVDLRLRASS